jgi:DNA replication and repair protein RecF
MQCFVRKLELLNFKNYSSGSFEFDERIVCIYGPNGSGKTSILDAIHFLCFTKSYFHHSDSVSIRNGESGMRIAGVLEDHRLNEVVCILRENGKKEFSLNGSNYTQYSAHIGKFPCVFITPDDVQLISEGSESRRKFLDTMISQWDPEYLNLLIQYNKCLAQRNSLLKQWATSQDKDFALLSVYSVALNKLGTILYEKRKSVCIEFVGIVNHIYSLLSGLREEIDVHYHSQLESDSLLTWLDRFIDKDIYSQRTNYGIHKDDMVFRLNGMSMKQAASQGQRKSFLFSLKLAQYEMLKQRSDHTPLLLLDDIFEKLDEERSGRLLNYLMKEPAQTFITDTHKERLMEAFKESSEHVQMIQL